MHLRIVINGASAAGFCGTVTWGTKEAPPPADNPAGPYPPADYFDPNGYGGGPNLPPIEGYPYTIIDAGERLPTLRLGVGSVEPWRSWCALQTPDPHRSGCYNDAACAVNQVSLQCLACSDAGGACVCDDSSCTAIKIPENEFDLTLAEDGNSLSGTFTGTSSLAPWYSYETSLYLEHVE
jgi:hypothetical protein